MRTIKINKDRDHRESFFRSGWITWGWIKGALWSPVAYKLQQLCETILHYKTTLTLKIKYPELQENETTKIFGTFINDKKR